MAYFLLSLSGHVKEERSMAYLFSQLVFSGHVEKEKGMAYFLLSLSGHVNEKKSIAYFLLSLLVLSGHLSFQDL